MPIIVAPKPVRKLTENPRTGDDVCTGSIQNENSYYRNNATLAKRKSKPTPEFEYRTRVPSNRGVRTKNSGWSACAERRGSLAGNGAFSYRFGPSADIRPFKIPTRTVLRETETIGKRKNRVIASETDNGIRKTKKKKRSD